MLQKSTLDGRKEQLHGFYFIRYMKTLQLQIYTVLSIQYIHAVSTLFNADSAMGSVYTRALAYGHASHPI